MEPAADLSRRERQIMEALFAKGEATVNEIQASLPDPPTPTAVRTLLKILVGKGRVKRRPGKVGREYLYSPCTDRARAGRSALQRVIQTFFDGSLEGALAAHLADRQTKLSEEQLQRAAELIEAARRREAGN